MTPELEFKRDSELITKFVVIAAGLSGDTELVKKAGVVDMLKDVGQSIIDDVKKRFQEEDWAAVATYFAYAKMGVLSPVYWIFQAVEFFGGPSPGDLLNSAVSAAKQLFEQNSDFTANDARDIANRIVSNASLDELYKIEKKGEIVSTLSTGLVKEAGISGNMFKVITRRLKHSQGKTLAGGLVKWLITAVLLGISFAVKGVSRAEGPSAIVSGVTGNSSGGSVSFPSSTSHGLKPSGKGNQYFINEGNKLWIVDLANGSSPFERIKNTIIQWAIAIYPELKDKSSELANSESIDKMVLILAKDYNEMYPAHLQIVEGLHTWKDIVDRSIGDVV